MTEKDDEIKVSEAERLEANMWLDSASERYRSAAMNDLMRGGPDNFEERAQVLEEFGLAEFVEEDEDTEDEENAEEDNGDTAEEEDIGAGDDVHGEGAGATSTDNPAGT